MTDIETARARLEAALNELKARQAHLNRDLTEPLDPDSAERAVEMEDDASIEAQAALVSREILSIDRALERISEGTYGICVGCGDDIAPARLEARPEAALCIGCASRQE